MKYLGTSFSLTLGAWRLRFSFDIEDAPCERAVAPHPHVRRVSERTPI